MVIQYVLHRLEAVARLHVIGSQGLEELLKMLALFEAAKAGNLLLNALVAEDLLE